MGKFEGSEPKILEPESVRDRPNVEKITPLCSDFVALAKNACPETSLKARKTVYASLLCLE